MSVYHAVYSVDVGMSRSHEDSAVLAFAAKFCRKHACWSGLEAPPRWPTAEVLHDVDGRVASGKAGVGNYY